MTTKTAGRNPMFSLGKIRETAKIGALAFTNLLLPPVCRLCNQPVPCEQDFCLGCEKKLTLSEPMMAAACTRCGRPRPRVPVDGEVSASEKCVQCEKEKLRFSSAIALWTYQDRVRDAVVAAKFGHQMPLGTALGRRLGQKIVQQVNSNAPAIPAPQIVTFVPSHRRRESQRGGNGNAAIAMAAFQEMKPRISTVCFRSLLRTTRATKKQAWLDNKSRVENVRDAFALKKGYPFFKQPIQNQHILVIDDVLTTGATANEISRVLLESGADRVTLAVVARAIQT